jgi:hypothetical protein
MTVGTAPEHDWKATLRRQKARPVDGQAEGGGYTDAFEIICRDCGDDPGWDYQDIPPRLQRIRGPYRIKTGVTEYQAHLALHEELARAR